MAMDTRDGLKATILSWLDDEELEDRIDDFIIAGEDRMSAELRIRELLVHETAFTIADGDRYEAFPSDFLDVKYLRIQTPSGHTRRFFPPLEELSIYEMTARSLDVENRPTAFCVHTQFEFDFEADQEYTGELFYYKKFDRLDGDTESNEILAAHPSLYLWSSLMASAPFLQHDERVPMWSSFYTELRDKLNEKHVQNATAGPRRSRVPNLPRRA